MAKRRRFTAKFKAKVVPEALNSESSQAELCRCHNLSETQVSKWKRQGTSSPAMLQVAPTVYHHKTQVNHPMSSFPKSFLLAFYFDHPTV